MQTTPPMPESFRPEGTWIPIVTPFAPDNRVDAVSLERLAERLLGDGATGLIALGTTGESATLADDERRVVVETCGLVSERMGRAFIVGAGSNSTASTITELERLVSVAKVAACLVVVPYYSRPSQAAVVEHFEIVADRSPVPLIVYNIPYRTGVNLEAAALLELAGNPNIAGLKQSVGALDVDTLQVLRAAPGNFAVLAGDDAFIVPTILMGAAGAITAAGHTCTPLFVHMVEAALRGDVITARSLAHSLSPVVEAGFAEPSPAVWKAVLARIGELASPRLRRPLTEASTQAAGRLQLAIDAALCSQR